MKYLSDYTLGEEFIVTPEIAEKLGYDFSNYLNAKCYVEMIDISSRSNLAIIRLSADYTDAIGDTHEQNGLVDIVNHSIDDCDKNLSLVHTLSTCADIHDVIIDDYTRRFFEIKRIIATYENGKIDIRYCTQSSNPDDDTIIFTEDKLKFFIGNNIYRHAKWNVAITALDTPVENK